MRPQVRHHQKGQFSSKGETEPDGKKKEVQRRIPSGGVVADGRKLEHDGVGSGTGHSGGSGCISGARTSRRRRSRRRHRRTPESAGKRWWRNWKKCAGTVELLPMKNTVLVLAICISSPSQSAAQPEVRLLDLSPAILVERAESVVVAKVLKKRKLVPSAQVQEISLQVDVTDVLKGQVPKGGLSLAYFVPVGGGSFSYIDDVSVGRLYAMLIRKSPSGYRSVRDIHQWAWRVHSPIAPPPRGKAVVDRIASLVFLVPTGSLDPEWLSYKEVRFGLQLTSVENWVRDLRRLSIVEDQNISLRACAALLERFPFDEACLNKKPSVATAEHDRVRLRAAQSRSSEHARLIKSYLRAPDPTSELIAAYPAVVASDIAFLRAEARLR